MIIFTILIFILGLCIGSFINVLIYRLPNELSLGGRSFCPKCKKKIAWYDNIPLISFILLKGKCRHCHSPISLQYPFVELLTGLLFVVSFVLLINNQDIRFTAERQASLMIYDLGFWVTVFYTFWIVSAFLAIFIIDLKHQIIPDQIILSTVVVTFIYQFFNSPVPIIYYREATSSAYLLSAIFACLFFYFLYKITKGKGMGFGDVKLVFLMGLILGYPKIVLALYLAFLTGAIVGVILILARIKKPKEPIAFGPFLSLATIVSYFLGTAILKWITALLF